MSSKAIRDKIAALLAKATSTDNEHEAETFMSKAQEMLEKYQLSLGDVIDLDDPIQQKTGVEQAASGHVWLLNLYRALGALYGCESVRVEFDLNLKGKWVGGYRQVLVGRESSIMTTELMYPWVVKQVRDVAKRLAKETGMSEQGQAKRVAAALITRIWIMAPKNTDLARTEAARRHALVVTNPVKAEYEKRFPDARPIKGARSVSDTNSREAAKGINLNVQVNGATIHRLK